MIINYATTYESIVIDPLKQDQINRIVAMIVRRQAAYEAVANKMSMPIWQPIAAVHYRESSLSMNAHLHNGDPLTKKTTHVPAGRPLTGTPPFTWVDSAVDALQLKGWDKAKYWTIPAVLVLLEKYNGLGYQKRGMPSPYLWSWTNAYQKGKYVADGKFDPDFIDKQCGVAPLLKLLL